MALTVTPTDEMKTLKVGEKIYEIVDDEARTDLSSVKADLLQLPTDGVTANSKQLLSENGTDNTEPYTFRAVPVNADRAEVNAVVGGTVAWNQLMQNGNFIDGATWFDYQCSHSVIDGVATITPTSITSRIYQAKSIVLNHKYLMMASFKGTSGEGNAMLSWYGGANVFVPFNGNWQNVALLLNNSFQTASDWQLHYGSSTNRNNTPYQIKNAVCFDLTQMFGSTIADYIYSLETATPGAGVAFFRKYFPNDYYPYDAGTLKHVEGVSSHDMVGFNQWDEEWVNGRWAGNEGAFNPAFSSYLASKNPIHVLPNTTYYFSISNSIMSSREIVYYDASDNWISDAPSMYTNGMFTTPSNCHHIRFNLGSAYGATYNHDICINLSDPAKNGTYEPYEKHSYALDPTVVLRGIPKLSDGKLTYDGDRYLPDGTVERRYGIVDLGTLNWAKNQTYDGLFDGSSLIPHATDISTVRHACDRFIAVDSTAVIAENNSIAISASGWQVYAHCDSYTDVASFKASLNGVLLVYELATPTTETATPYQSLQICDPNGTEEFVTTGIVPVGHETRYPENLRAKIEGLPWDFSTLIAPTETGTASRNYTVGSLLIMGNVLYKVTANIANGGTITPGTNCTATTLSEVISALS